MTPHHQSVLLRECLELFRDSSLSIFVDGTLGAGGHAEAILTEHPEIELYIGIDQDPQALAIAKERLKQWDQKLRLIPGNFSHISRYLKELAIPQVDGILLDIGVSSMQFDTPERGFSFRSTAPLDMRMNPTDPVTAEIILNEWPEKEIARIFRDYGEIKPWRRAAQKIAEVRQKQRIATTTDLVTVLEPVLMRFKKPGLHPLTLVFQALRIAVNRELEVLEETVPQAVKLLAPGGRIAIISFHSLEDRIVKNILRFEASDKYSTSGVGGLFQDKQPIIDLITKRPIVPTPEEMEENPRSRSAKLRGAQKL